MASDSHDEHAAHERRGGHRAHVWVFVGFALIAGYFLWTEHRAHVQPYLPYALLLACPLLHLLHGHGGGHRGPRRGHDEDR